MNLERDLIDRKWIIILKVPFSSQFYNNWFILYHWQRYKLVLTQKKKKFLCVKDLNLERDITNWKWIIILKPPFFYLILSHQIMKTPRKTGYLTTSLLLHTHTHTHRFFKFLLSEILNTSTMHIDQACVGCSMSLCYCDLNIKQECEQSKLTIL